VESVVVGCGSLSGPARAWDLYSLTRVGVINPCVRCCDLQLPTHIGGVPV